jgi:hypothetical protein
VTTRKTYPFRSFYRGKQRVAFYVISVVGEESAVTVYSDDIKGYNPLGFKKSQIEEDQLRVHDYLRKYLPEDLADAVLKFARKDLGCKASRFSLKSYIHWKKPKP